MKEFETLDRREFLKVSFVSGLGLLLMGCGLNQEQLTATSAPTPSPVPTETIDGAFAPNVFVLIRSDNHIEVTIPHVEIGQGVRTALAMILVEELDCAWDKVSVAQAPGDIIYGDQDTGGSLSVSTSWRFMRLAGATARAMLVQAAANRWNASADDLHTENGAVWNADRTESLEYGSLVLDASALEAPRPVDLVYKSREDYRLIGTDTPRVNAREIVTGTAEYGSDIRLEGMVFACIARPKVPEGVIGSYDGEVARAVDGVLDVLQIEAGIAVIAENSWAAIQGRDALKATTTGGRTDISTDSVREQVQITVDNVINMGSYDRYAAYEVPYFAHATMEPLNTVAYVQGDSCEVWAPTQVPLDVQARISSQLGININNVTVHIPTIGGGFGRRRRVDFVEEAVEISAKTGLPVQTVWTRADDIHHDFFHPFSITVAYADLSLLTPPRMRTIYASNPVRTGSWRAVNNVQEAFALQCFTDELAEELGMGPFEIRRVTEDERLQGVLDRLEEVSGWRDAPPPGVGRGIACHSTWGHTHVAEMAEVTLDENERLKVERVVVVIDCGMVVNPNMVREQMEGGIAFALTALLNKAITIEDGQVQQSNFNNYPLLRNSQMPEVEVHIIESDNDPSGVGEMGGPPLIPAVLNAYAQLTGKRVRKIPIEQ